jgi:predicted enzyme related to lactoylglutathione lyase
MFEIRDPDGHTLWFGQSYNETLEHPPLAMLEKALPWFPLNDVAAGVTYYREALGFRINYQQQDMAVMDRDQVTLLLIERTPRHKGVGSASFYIRDADELHAELVARGAQVQGEPVSQPWGLRTFVVMDPEGNELQFAQPFE